ncbi:MAG: hypothetical protein H7144_12400 [Burkholderiales bacterium]|nr:hypothetical protein [Phycisphaerae bacterium]
MIVAATWGLIHLVGPEIDDDAAFLGQYGHLSDRDIELLIFKRLGEA